ncbi:hypothetical protein GYMLUDRAFT_64037 [Collybiopsis luxurians FD-317 M1]|uniref:Uncharacterized protein n=1 Tax=Collybiopsis luxurians FD-317 M1 TaxID=944289 RepID=A0A0D0CCV0_9AGAR|nr:hypothetical protein GYMLUDRAFT_64037 [Collybiopsis luxurians FD-317 M1]
MSSAKQNSSRSHFQKKASLLNSEARSHWKVDNFHTQLPNICATFSLTSNNNVSSYNVIFNAIKKTAALKEVERNYQGIMNIYSSQYFSPSMQLIGQKLKTEDREEMVKLLDNPPTYAHFWSTPNSHHLNISFDIGELTKTGYTPFSEMQGTLYKHPLMILMEMNNVSIWIACHCYAPSSQQGSSHYNVCSIPLGKFTDTEAQYLQILILRSLHAHNVHLYVVTACLFLRIQIHLNSRYRV